MVMHWPQVVVLALFVLHALLLTLFDWLLSRRPPLLPYYVAMWVAWIWLLWKGGFFTGCAT